MRFPIVMTIPHPSIMLNRFGQDFFSQPKIFFRPGTENFEAIFRHHHHHRTVLAGFANHSLFPFRGNNGGFPIPTVLKFLCAGKNREHP